MTPRPSKRRQHYLVGGKIRQLRKSRHLTQSVLATQIGIQQSDLCRMETGEYKVSLDVLFKILAVFEMNMAEFFEEVGHAGDGGEEEILSLWRRLDNRGREEVLDFLRFKCQQGQGD